MGPIHSSLPPLRIDPSLSASKHQFRAYNPDMEADYSEYVTESIFDPPAPSRNNTNTGGHAFLDDAASTRTRNVLHATSGLTTQYIPSGRMTTQKLTGFRGKDTPLIPIDAPIQHRTYTQVKGRKRKVTEALEVASVSSNCDEEEGGEDEQQKKKIANTLSARRSRQRKQQYLADLEVSNQELLEQNLELRKRMGLLTEEAQRILEDRDNLANQASYSRPARWLVYGTNTTY